MLKEKRERRFASPFFDLLSDRLRLGEHQLCPALGAERHLARKTVEAHGLAGLERDALLADNNVDLARAAVDEHHALAAANGLALTGGKGLSAHPALALALAEHEVEVAAAAPGMGAVPAVEAVDLIGVQRQLFAAVMAQLDRPLERGDQALIVGQRRKVRLCVLNGRGAESPQKVAVRVHRALGRDAELRREAARPLGGDVILRR